MARSVIIASLTCVLFSKAVLAQRTNNNAVTQAEDAFGKSVGDQSIGIYNADDVRGFSPYDAGNIRLEGLYFDEQGGFTDRLIAGSQIRIGLSAQGYAFPAPTGIVDYHLQKPGAERLVSIGLDYGPFGTKSAQLDVQLPIKGDVLGLAGGVDVSENGTSYGGTENVYSTSMLLRYAPRDGVEIIPFWMRSRSSDSEAQSLIFTPKSAAFLPPRYARGPFYGQSWADSAGTDTNYGVVAKADPLGFDVRLGVFRSSYDNAVSANDLYIDTDASGHAPARFILIERGDSYTSTSGELRVSRGVTDGPRHHMLIASVRARVQDRRYGGGDYINVGPSQIGVVNNRPLPAIVDGAKTQDRITQTTFGLAYEGKWLNVGEVTIGIQKVRYAKRVTDPDPTIVTPQTHDSPILLSATAAATVSPTVALYAGYTRGLEESATAPSDAVNFNFAPPAIRTEQKDAGVRWKLTKRLTAVVGVFDISKPYYNVDASNVFGQLGIVRHRGVEMSLAGRVAPGVSLIIGNLFLDATVSGSEVQSGAIGRRPIGATARRTIASVDYRLPKYQALSFDMFLESKSAQVANAANTLSIPSRVIFNIGTRYRFKLGGAEVLLRGEIQNVTNRYGWNVGGSGYFVQNGARRFALSLSADL